MIIYIAYKIRLVINKALLPNRAKATHLLMKVFSTTWVAHVIVRLSECTVNHNSLRNPYLVFYVNN